jgi:hypothetical protein
MYYLHRNNVLALFYTYNGVIESSRVMQEGMGSMKITHGGLRLSGRTLVTDRLVATAIRSRAGRPLLIESAANITLNARNTQGRLVNSLKLSE